VNEETLGLDVTPGLETLSSPLQMTPVTAGIARAVELVELSKKAAQLDGLLSRFIPQRIIRWQHPDELLKIVLRGASQHSQVRESRGPSSAMCRTAENAG